ncbi:DNA-directed RNA polymerase subunit H [Candidatus Woesearchaeota archaeon]|nr:DNA-directed RNA polymerase subunit H [Candidatus Woesearchaeota archaeon]
MNIQKHLLIPKHIKLPEDEKQKLLQSFNITLSQLPSIYESDPSIKELNAIQGDVIKIMRQSPTSSESIFYRVVING